MSENPAAGSPSPETSMDLETVIREVFEERIPFNRQLGLVVDSLGPDEVGMSFERRDWMIGNFVRRALHGGVISSVLDVVGGLVVFVELLRSDGRSERAAAERIRSLGAISTIDLRVDYLRAAVAERYRAVGRVLRSGNRVAVTRTELFDPEGVLVAVGTASYRIGRPRPLPAEDGLAAEAASVVGEAGS